MRIVSWNCQMAFRDKAACLKPLDADIYVIPESEDLDRLGAVELLCSYPNRQWKGNNENKGLLVASKVQIALQVIPEYNPAYRDILPVKIHIAGKPEFYLLAVWTRSNPKDRRCQYIGQLWLALQEYAPLLTSPWVIVGDFNSNPIWDNEYPRVATHSQTAAFLEAHGIRSLYHESTKEEPGRETCKTFALNRNVDKGYHIDYCFLSNTLIQDSKISIPPLASWIDKSDHVPLIIDFQLPHTR